MPYSRVVTSQPGKLKVSLSLIKASAFDKDWDEIKGKQISYRDVNIPDDLEEQLALLDKSLDNDPCRARRMTKCYTTNVSKIKKKCIQEFKGERKLYLINIL